MGEDPYLVAMLGAAYVRGLQSAGRHRHPQALRRLLRLPRGPQPRPGVDGPARADRRDPAAVRDRRHARGRRGSVMNSYSDVDGVPAGADRWLLTDLLRDEWGFTGTVVSDYWAVPFLATMHRVAADADEAGAQALTAGIDVELPDTIGFGRARRAGAARRGAGGARRPGRPAAAHAEGRARPARPGLDAGGARWPGRRPSTSTRPPTARWPASWPSARSCCSTRASALPLAAPEPAAGWPWSGRAPTTRARSWAATPSPTTCCPAIPGSGSASTCRPRSTRCGPSCPTSRSSTSRAAPCSGDDRSGFAAARRRGPRRRRVRRARRRPRRPVRPRHLRRGLRRRRTCGCPGVQADLLAELLATGTPVVVVVVSGRPVRARRRARHGGRARPGVHAGRGGRRRRSPACCPAGSSPGGQAAGADPARARAASRAPTCSRRSAAPRAPASATSTRRRCSRSATAARTPPSRSTTCGSATTEVPTDGEFTVTVRVRNTGDRAGDEVVQLYLHDVLAQVARPVRQLTGFARVPLEPGAARRRPVPRARRPDRVHRARPAPDRRARRPRGPRRHVGGRPALPGQRPADRPAARGRRRPPARHPGGREPRGADA